MNPKISVGSFPYKPGFNPYQKLITDAIEDAEINVVRIPPKKWFPLQHATRAHCDILHLDWPHDWYNGKNHLFSILKSIMYRHGLNCLQKKITVWTAHNLLAHDAVHPHREKLMIQKLINKCQGIMVLSEASKKVLAEQFHVPPETEIEKIYHGHYIDCYSNHGDRLSARKKLNLDKESFVYLCSGALKPYKGHIDLINAFSTIASKRDVLIIAGNGSEDYVEELGTIANQCSRRTKGKIIIIPKFIENNEFQIFYNAADVTVLPFKNILNSGSLLLAMSFGSPVIAPYQGSIPEIAMAEYFFGYSLSSNSETMTANLATAMIHSKDKLTQTVNTQLQKRQIIEFTKDKYDWKKAGVLLRNWYIKLLDKNA